MNKRIKQLVIFGLLAYFTQGCLPALIKCEGYLVTDQKIHRLWNSLQSQQDKELLQVGLQHLLERLLQADTHRLQIHQGTFRVIRVKWHHTCQGHSTTLTQLHDPHFLQQLYRFVKAKKLQIDGFIDDTTPPPPTPCTITNAVVEFTYWKAISHQHAKKQWKEACSLGRNISQWRHCLSKDEMQLVTSRINQICR